MKPADKTMKTTEKAMRPTHKAMRAHDRMPLIIYVNMQCFNVLMKEEKQSAFVMKYFRRCREIFIFLSSSEFFPPFFYYREKSNSSCGK